jgi:hypothetical protein
MVEEHTCCLASAATLPEAYAWREALQEEGITASVVGVSLAASPATVADNPAELWVREKDRDRAAAILETFQPRCPHSR